MNAIRIAHLIYSPAIGGSEMVAVNICSNLDTSKFHPMVLFMYKAKGPLEEILSERGISSHHLDRSYARRLFGPFLLALSLASLKIDVLHVHHVPLLMAIKHAAKLAGIKGIVLTEHAKYSISRSLKMQSECRKAADYLHGSFVSISDDLKAYFVNELGIDANKIIVIQNGVDSAKYCPGQRTEELLSLIPPSHRGPVIATVGRLAEAKDHENFLQALSLLKKDHHCPLLIIVGDGEMRGQIEKSVKEKELLNEVVLVGSRSDVERILPGVDAFVISSKREGLPMALLEAMSAGLPVVSTSVGGIPEVIQNGMNGLMVPPENPEKLADALKKILIDREMAKKLGNEARNTVVRNYSMKIIAQTYSRVYSEIFTKRNI